MNGGIYLMQDNGQLIEMVEQTYDSEKLLQELLAQYPNKLLAGDQMGYDEARRWLLVSSEVGLPSEGNGNDRWSVDLLFLDQDAIPTLVEVKRSSSTDIRREVVGQMLDYAANAVVNWSIEKLKQRYEAYCESQGFDAEKVLREHLRDRMTLEGFWQEAETNLLASKMRLIFASDKIPTELQRIVEFLNKNTKPVEVLAVEITQYAGQGLKTFVPRVIGQTAEAQQKKAATAREESTWDEDSFIEELNRRQDTTGVEVAKKILLWAKNQNLELRGGTGAFDGAVWPSLPGISYYPISVRTGGKGSSSYIQLQFTALKANPPFDDETKRRELLQRLNTIPGVREIKEADKYPGISLSKLREESVLNQFLEVLDWVIQEMKSRDTG